MERLPGFRDFYPDPVPNPEAWSADARQFIFDRWHTVARNYGFRQYDGPPLEPLELFTLKSGQEIVGQLYNFKDKGDREIALRPEMTPTLARMVSAAERNYKKPIKWYAIPQLFRYERQQRGRLREHFQFNADIIGESHPAADAELISLLIDSLRAFGLTAEDFVIRLSSRNAWQEFFQQRQGNLDRAYEFYQVIDKLERDSPEDSERKLKPLGITLAEVNAFVEKAEPTTELQTVLDNLKARGLDGFVKVDYHIIRGLAYYTGIVFEAFAKKGDLRAIAGGGRYDNLIKLISGGKVDLPSLGFGMGDVVLLELLKDMNLAPRSGGKIDVFCIIDDEGLRASTLSLVQQMRNGGLSVEYSLTPSKADKQFKRAMELSAGFTAKVEKNAGGEHVIRVKNLRDRTENAYGIQEAIKICSGEPV